MNVDDYFEYLTKLKANNDINLLNSTIEANKLTFNVYLKDVKYLKRIIRKVRSRLIMIKKRNKKSKKKEI